MAYQAEVGSGSARAISYHDLLDKIIQFYTSQHVATVAVNAGGTGYTVGDILTLTHASAHLDAKFEVTTVSSGVITGLRIVCSGAFAQQASSATVSAGGSGYVVGDILEVQGGTTRCPAKFSVATLSGSAVATVSLVEGGGAYSSTPGNPAATVGVGPAAYAGDDACTLTVTYQSIIGTTGLSVTGGTGSGATVDITLAETGWTVDSRNTNNITVNSVTNERVVVLVGDASGQTNKPFIGIMSGTATSGLTTRYFLALHGMIAHNPALAFSAVNFKSTGWNGTSFNTGGSYLLCAQDTGGGTSTMDFWFNGDDQHIEVYTQLDDTISVTDNGVYMQVYAGLMDRIGTETENPYPYFIFASSNQTNLDPGSASTAITGLAEQCHSNSGPGYFWRNSTATWVSIRNHTLSGSPGLEDYIMAPVGKTALNDDDNEGVVDAGTQLWQNFFKLDRTSATTILRKVPGSSSEFFLHPLSVISKPNAPSSATDDVFFGQPKNVYWISSDDGTGSRISNFSEDYVTIGSDRYLVLHNHVHTEPYQYIAIKQDV